MHEQSGYCYVLGELKSYIMWPLLPQKVVLLESCVASYWHDMPGYLLGNAFHMATRSWQMKHTTKE